MLPDGGQKVGLSGDRGAARGAQRSLWGARQSKAAAACLELAVPARVGVLRPKLCNQLAVQGAHVAPALRHSLT